MKLKQHLLIVLMIILGGLGTYAQVAVPFTQRLAGGSVKIKGDIVFVGNNITNRAPAATPSDANNPYNGTANNNGLNFEYIDVDGDASTFSSSTADLAIATSCKRIVYAGLYWTATYPFERSGPGGDGTSSNYTGSPRNSSWNQVKFKVPGGAYVDLTADNAADPPGDEDSIIFDGFNAANPSSSFYAAPYVCYKNVTSLVQALANANGTYAVANQRAARGIRPDGISSGWSLVVIYESPTLPSKYISVFDGYANIYDGINAANAVDFTVNGFQTLPAPLPVRARIGVSTLEGDYSLTNDRFRIRANSVGGFTTLSNAVNPADNFFNGSISTNGAIVTTRNPNSTNTLGYDLDIVNVNNPTNSVIPNGETGATLRVTTNGDAYGTYLSTFDVEIIEPVIALTKVVQDIAGNDIGNAEVQLCQDLVYVIGFQNIGNDDAQNFTIRDVLPVNVTLDLAATQAGLPAGVTVQSYVGGVITFAINNSLVQIGDPRVEIRLRVKVVCSCIEMDDACSNLIQNQAFATYQGVLNTAQITDDPSLSSFVACNLGDPSPSNFLVNLDNCNFTRTEILCGPSIVLTAANGYQTYTWSGPGTITPVPGTNNQSVTVTQPGTYTVNDIINTSPCKSIVETINVITFGAGLTNPVIPYADQVVVCPNNGTQLPLIFLCGTGDSQLIQTNITGATGIDWYQLSGTCTPLPPANCPNENVSCTWNLLSSGPNFNATFAGQFKLIVRFPGGCDRTFYFNVYENILNPTYVSRDIICSTPGQITVNNVPAGYEYSLSPGGPWQTGNTFSIPTAGTYTVYIRQIGVTGGCVFTIPNIGIRARNFTASIVLTQPLCTGDKGSINIAANDGEPQYTYTILQGATVISTAGPMVPNNYVFNNLNPGNYTYQVTTQDGCLATGNFTINTPPVLTLTAALTRPLTCTDGEITVYPVGGTPPYNYVVTGAVSVTQSSPVITAPVAGTYNIQVSDFNNCTATTSIVVTQVQPPVYTIVDADILCASSGNTGTITINVSNANGNTLMYSINGAAGPFVSGNVFTNLAPGTYNVVVQYTYGGQVCTTTPQAVVITAPPALTGTATVSQPLTCIQPGIITVNASGGTPGYTYSINGGATYQASNTFTVNTAGTYTITIRDNNGCTITRTVVVPAVVGPSDLYVKDQVRVTCPSLTGSLNIDFVPGFGGVPPRRFRIVSPAAQATPYTASGNFLNLPPGAYTFEIIDGNGCTYQETFVLDPIVPTVITPQVTNNVRCFGTATGSGQFIISNIPNGTDYNYTVTNSGGTTIASASGTTPASGSTNITVNLPNLPASTYTISVYNDYNECTNTASFTITQPASALTATLSSTPITCTTNGTVTVNASGGWGGYTYSIAPNAGITQSGSTFSNITAGTYTLTTTDSGGCQIANTITFTNAPALSATISATSDFCYDATNGATIVVTPVGGTPGYTYTINGSPNASNTFGPLTPGTYNIIVTDSFGCTFTLPAQTINPELILTTNLTKDLDCTASPNAVITGTVSGGYSPYTYTVNATGPFPVSGPGNTFTYSTATAGTYQFVVTDSRGCVTAISSFTIAPLSLPQITSVTQTQQILCNGDSTAAINVVIDTTVGTAPYVINVLNTTTGTNYGTQTTGLPAGNYLITLTDAKSCTDTETITITQPAPINFTAVVNPITCSVSGTSLGSICVNGLTGGTAPYTYNLYDLTGGTGTQTFATPLPVNHCFTNINFGIYNLEVVDANGCTLIRTNLIMSSPPSDLDIVVSSSIPSCATGGTAVVSVPGGLGGPYEFAIMVNPDPSNGANIYLPADAGFPLQHTFNGLTPGAMYTFIVHDLTTGCYYFEQSATTIPTNSTMVVNPLVANNVTCIGAADGSVTFTVTGVGAGAASVTYTIFNAQTNLSTGITGVIPAPFPSVNAGPLSPGNYYIQLTENGGVNGGCGIISSTFTIAQSSTPLAVSATATNDDCNVNGGLITAVGTGGTAPYRYSFVLSPGVPVWGVPGVNTANVESGTYDVFIQDANGCIRSTTVTVNLDPTPVIAATAGSACGAQGTYQITTTLTSPGVGPYTLSLDGGAFVTHTLPHVFGSLSSGTHTVQVRDFNGCGNTVSVTILNPLIGSAAFTTQPTCNNSNGQITVTTTGGSGNYSYSITPNPGVILAGNVFSNVPPGSYVITINDTTTGCSITTSANLALANPVTFTTTTTPVVCNGDSNGTITATLSAGNNNPAYTYQITAPPGFITGPQSSNVFTGLPAGTYTILVTSGRGCTATQSATISTPTPVVASGSATPFTCAADNSVNTSTLTITGAGGITPYTYSIDGINYFTTNTFNVVDNGAVQNITIYVRDANGCIDSDVIVINPLPALVSATITQNAAITCTNPEQVTVTVTGGSGNFNYELIPASGTATPQPQASNVFTITTPGTYSIRVNDLTTGCYIMTVPYVIAPYDTIQVDVTATNAVTCFGGNDGSIAITITGYTGAYTYNVLDSTNTVVLAGAGNTSTNPMTIAGLGAGNYTVQITETNTPFCTEMSGIVSVVGPTATLALNAVLSAPLTCDPNTAQITATATGGWGTYEYELVGPVNAAFSSNNVFSNLPAGNYTVNVRDLEGCLASVPVTITTPTPINTTVTPSTTLLTCYGDTNATITIAYPTGGQGSNYSYIFNTIAPVASSSGPITMPLAGATITGLGAGTYNITITDGFNCTFTSANIVINQPTEVNASLVLTNLPSCNNPTVLALTASGGTAPYTYSADGVTYSAATFNPSVTISIPAGTTGVFHYFVRDANGCVSVVSNDIQIDPIPAMTLSTLTQGNILCGGSATGTITAVAQGGLGNYTYSLVDAGGNPIAVGTQATPGVFTNLPAGTYYIHVVSTNAFGTCLYTSGPVTITEPPVFVVNYAQQNVKCNGGSDGTITVTTSGGTGIVKYAISPNLDQFIDLPANGVVGNLPAGSYTIIVQDQNGCFDQYNFTISEPTILGASIANIVPEVCAEDNAGSFDIVNIVGGTAPYTVSYNVIYSGTTTVVNGPVINLASGVTSWSFTGLNGGEYEVIVTDANGCTYSTQFILDPGVLFDPQALVTFPCVANLPAVEVEVLNMSNAPSNAFSPLSDYLFSLDDPTMATAQNSNIFTSANYPSLLVPNTHVIYVTNANGCAHQTLAFTITATDVDPLTLVLQQGGLNEIAAVSTGGSGGNTYTFNGHNNGGDNTYVYDQTGPYTVTVTDSSGCSVTVTQPFTFIPIYIPDVFTPDGDGNNDEWKPQNTSIYPNLKTKVYDRYGRVVAELNEGQGWNGKYHGNELPSGDYWYVLKVDGNDGEEFVGHFTLYR